MKDAFVKLIIIPIITGLLFYTGSFVLGMYRMHDAMAQAPHGIQSEEVPRGAIDGVNSSFALNFQPAPFGSLHVFRNGLRQKRNLDYILTGPNHMQIVFQPLPVVPPGTIGQVIPQPGDILLADYTY